MIHRLLFILCLFSAGADGGAARPRPASLPYLSPMPGAKRVSNRTNVIVRLVGGPGRYGLDPATMFSVNGSRSGPHPGFAVVSDDGETVVFEPDVPFEPGESVAVTLCYADPKRTDVTRSFQYGFTVSPAQSRPRLPEPGDFLRAHGFGPTPARESPAPARASFPSAAFVPPSGFPTYDIGAVDNPGDGYIFMANFLWTSDPSPSFLMILRNDGTPHFFKRSKTFALDFKRQNDRLLSYYEFGSPGFVVMDSTYTEVDVYGCGNGYAVDPHDLQILDNGHYLIICQDRQPVDMSRVVPGGDPGAEVIGMVFQELDRSKNVVFEWRSWDHFNITDAINVDLTGSTVDYVHANALVLDHDGNWLVSSRHLSEITKIDRSTGDIIWRWGGKNNQFRFVGDIDDTTGFHYQHDIRRLENGNYMLYDNGNFHTPPFSRAVEYRLDARDMTATLVWQYRDTPDVFADYMGSSQRLPGGNTFIGWGGSTSGPITTLTEVRANGEKAFELTLTNRTLSYRAFRFPWSGTAREPFLWAGTFDRATRTLMLGFDKFGDRTVAFYEIYSGNGPEALALFDSSTTNGCAVTGLVRDQTYRFRIRAVDHRSVQSPFSNEVVYRYQNSPPAPPRLATPPDHSVVESAGVELTWHRSPDGEDDPVTYDVVIFEEDGVKRIEGIVDTSYVYNRSGNTPLSRFSWTVGCSDHEMSTTSPDTFTVRSSRAGFGVPAVTALHPNYPNPFNPATTIRFDLHETGPVSLRVYNVLGQEVRTLLNEERPPGYWAIRWDGLNNIGEPVGTGVYLYRLETPVYSGARKLVIVR